MRQQLNQLDREWLEHLKITDKYHETFDKKATQNEIFVAE